jgi:hypothetical protein
MTSFVILDTDRLVLSSIDLKKPIVLIPRAGVEPTEWLEKFQKVAKMDDVPRMRQQSGSVSLTNSPQMEKASDQATSDSETTTTTTTTTVVL